MQQKYCCCNICRGIRVILQQLF